MNPLLAGRYRIGARLGRGGSADVFAGHDELLDRAVAVKVARRAGDPTVRGQALAAARLDHPRIVRILDLGVDHGCDWVVLDLVDGASAGDLVASLGPLEPAAAVAAMLAVLDGLAHAHAHGVLHGDLSPGNLLVPVEAGRPCWAQSRLTDLAAPVQIAGAVVISPHYAAPELAVGDPGDERSDLYAAGAVLVHLLTGAPPFDDPDPQAVLAAQVGRQPVAPSSRRPGLSPALDEVVLTALAKDPGDRYPSAASMGAALRRLPVPPRPGQGPVDGRPVGPPRPRPVVPGGRGGTREMPPARAPAPQPARSSAPPPGGAGDAGGSPDRPAGPRGRGRPARVGWSVLVVLAAVAVALLGGSTLVRSPSPGVPPIATGSATGAPVPAAPSSPSPARGGPAAPAPTPSTVRVPDLIGASSGEARSRLAALGLTLGPVVEQDGPSDAGLVLGLDPGVGTRLPPGAPVTVTIASGWTAVPQLTGQPADPAVAALAAAGLDPVPVTVTGPQAATVPSGAAIGTLPVAGTRVAVGTPVRLLVAGTQPPAATPTPTGTGVPTWAGDPTPSASAGPTS